MKNTIYKMLLASTVFIFIFAVHIIGASAECRIVSTRFEVKLSDGNYTEITDSGIQSGEIKFSGVLSGVENFAESLSVYSALFNEYGLLEHISLSDTEASESGETSEFYGIITVPEGSGYSMKIFIWDNCSPVCEAVCFDSTKHSYDEDEEINDIYDSMRVRWKNNIVGGRKYYDTTDSDIAAMISDIDSTANKLQSSMNKSAGRQYLWSSYKYSSSSKNPNMITGTFGNLKNMAIAYKTPASSYYNDQALKANILDGLEWVYNNWYNENITLTNSSIMGNWWEWEIGIPLAFADTAVLMYSDLSNEQLKKYCAALEHFCPDPRYRELEWMGGAYHGAEEEGANRIWKCLHVLTEGVLSKNPERIALSKESAEDVFVYVDEQSGSNRDGFYTDGTFIQHGNVPYNAGYGASLLNEISGILCIVNRTPWDIKNENKKMLCDWIINSYEPIIYKGAAMDMFRGRGIAEVGTWDRITGHELVRSIVNIFDYVPDVYSKRFKSMVKYWVNCDKNIRSYWNDTASATDTFYTTVAIKQLLADDTLEERGPLVKNQVFAAGDRVVHLRDTFGFGISMSSPRVFRYSCINDANVSGWYTGAGMTYFFNDDYRQWQSPFWATVDKTRLPGTTSEQRAHENKEGANAPGASSYAGGVSLLDLYGAAGMQWQEYDSTTRVKKSWFMFDNEVVALGADIHSDENVNINTTIENKPITWQLPLKTDTAPNGLPTLTTGTYISGEEQDVTWAWLGNSGPGIYFPDKTNLSWIREYRSGAFSDLNPNASSKMYYQNYITLFINHGKNPNTYDSAYEYVLLPEAKKVDAVSSYAQNPDVSVLMNNRYVQAVHEKTLNITAANFFENESMELGGYFSTNKKSSIMCMENNGEFYIAVSDPTQENTGSIDIVFEKNVKDVITCDERITVKSMNPLKVSVNTNDAKGKSICAKFDLQ